MKQICEEDVCTGCGACFSVCPVNAIEWKQNILKKDIPIINSDKCLSCNRCLSVCPNLVLPTFVTPIKAVAAWSKDEDDKVLSASGGISAVLARAWLKNGGIVYGAAFQNQKVFHIRLDNIEKIDLIRDSKYVQSDTHLIYKSIKSDLSHTKVLFLGTPCQVAAVKSFCNYDHNLFTVDLICHGVVPFPYLAEHISLVSNTRDWTHASFRKKGFSLQVFDKHGSILYSKVADEDLYYSSFLQSLIFRDNCYKCPYSMMKRCSDITIGDFWGINRDNLLQNYSGKISLVLINSDSGVSIFNLVKDDIVWEERPIEEAVNPSQGNLIHPSQPHKDRSIFEKNYPSIGFEKAIEKTKIGRDIRKKSFFDKLYKSKLYFGLHIIKDKILRHLNCQKNIP